MLTVANFITAWHSTPTSAITRWVTRGYTMAKANTKAAPAAPARGAVTLVRWAACQKGKPGAVTLTGAAVKAMPLATVITNTQAQNPTRNRVSPWPAYGFNNVVGATTTLGQYIAAITKANMGGATQACAHVAWHANHGYVTLAAPAPAAPVATALVHLA